MGNAITQDLRAIWLSLVSDGGWWTANNLRLHWSPTFTADEMLDHLVALHGGGFIERQEFQCVARYAFTSSCKQLPGGAPQLAINGETV